MRVNCITNKLFILIIKLILGLLSIGYYCSFPSKVIVVQHQVGNSAIFQLTAISWREQVNFQRDDDVRFVLDQHN
jgi:hypothetical protein